MPRRGVGKKHLLVFVFLVALFAGTVAVIIWLEVRKSNSAAAPVGTVSAVPAVSDVPAVSAGQTSQARPCDAELEAVPESERVKTLGARQCAVVYPEKYGRVYLRLEGSKYLGIVDGKLRVVGGESAAVFKFKRVTNKTFVVTVSASGPAGQQGPAQKGAVLAVDARTGEFYVRDESAEPPTLVVTGVPKRDVIAVHRAKVYEGAVVRAETDAVVVAMVRMDGTSAYGIYEPEDVSALLEESMARAKKVRAMHASCCSRFGPSCVDPKDAVLKPMCCTECKDTLETCPELVRYDAWPLIQRETCCASIAMLGVSRVYGDTECAVVPGTCDRTARIEQTILTALDGVYVPSFGEVAVARFLCNELYTT